ncbi:unnamed protein product [Prunus armeniaca]
MLAIARVYFLPYVGNCYDGSVSGGVDGEEQENFLMMLRVMRLTSFGIGFVLGVIVGINFFRI